MPISFRKFFYILIVLSAVIYIIAAINNEAYLHPDEHYQIIEFASYKLGSTPLSALPWEYAAHIRPTFQPSVVYVLLRTFNILHITDHYTQLTLLRLLTALFSLLAISLFCFANLSSVSDGYKRLYILLTYMLWMPYVYGTHYSSETWSGNFFLLAVSLLLLLYDKKLKWTDAAVYTISGLLIGLAFICRFQIAFFGAGLGVWLLFFKKEKYTSILSLIAGVAVIMTLGVLLDSYFYHEWVYTPWRYVKYNIIDGVANHYGMEPMYQYLIWLLTFSFVPVGIAIVVFLGVFFIRFPRHIIFWVLVPYLLGHSLISHKEERFLYPAINFFPIAMILAYQSLRSDKDSWLVRLPGVSRSVLFYLLVLINAGCLLFGVILHKDFNSNPRTFAYRLHMQSQQQPMDIFYVHLRSHPFIFFGNTMPDLTPTFLQEDAIHTARLVSAAQLDSTDAGRQKLIATNLYEMDTIQSLTGTNQYRILLRSMPAWTASLPLGKAVEDYVKKNTFCILEMPADTPEH